MSTVAFVIGAINAIGGIIGFTKSGSNASLIAGTTFGVLFSAAGLLIGQRNIMGARIAVVSSLALLGAMGPKALRTKAPVPVLMVILGLSGLIVYAQKWNRI